MPDEFLQWFFCTKTAAQENAAKEWAKTKYLSWKGHVVSWTIRKAVRPGTKPIGVDGYLPKSSLPGLIAELKACPLTVSIVHNFKPIYGTYIF